MSVDSKPFHHIFGAEHIYLFEGAWQREDTLENSDRFEPIVLGYVNDFGSALQQYGLSPRKLRIPPFPNFSFQLALTKEAIFLVLGQSATQSIRYARYKDYRQLIPTPTLESVLAECEQKYGWESCLGASFTTAILKNHVQLNEELEKEANIIAKQFAVQATQRKVDNVQLPPSVGNRPMHDLVLPRAVVIGTRRYIEKVVDQINGTYENGYFDACAVMIRRLIETLIIEVFEGNALAEQIQSKDGDYLQLSKLIIVLLSTLQGGNLKPLSRNTKKALESLPTLKAYGDFSAHNRMYTAYREDIDRIIPDLRVTVQELIMLAKVTQTERSKGGSSL